MYRIGRGLEKGARASKAQSTVEYIVLVTAVIAVVILFANNNNSGLRKKMNDVLTNSAEDIKDRSGKLAETHEGSDAAKDAAIAIQIKPNIDVNPTLNMFNNN